MRYSRGQALLAKLMDRTPNRPDGECWIWGGTRDTAGYGRMRHQGRRVGAHRLMFYAVNGYYPEETRHTCDNPPCVNPSHLLDGTRSTNQRDAFERGRRTNAGRHNPNARYTPTQIAEVKELCTTHTLDQVQAMTGVHRSTVHRIRHGLT